MVTSDGSPSPGEGPGTTSRALREAAVVAVGVLVGYLLLRISPLLILGALSDDGIYVALGKALADGEGYRSVYAAGDAVHAKYPPGLPVVHAMLWKFSDSLARVHQWALLLSAGVTALAAGVLWWVGRVRYGLGVVGLATFVIGPLFLESSVQYLNLAISEPWFLLGWALTLAFFPVAFRVGGLSALAVGIVVGLTALFRSQALVSLPAFVLAAWLSERANPSKAGGVGRPTGLLAVGALLPVLTWRLWSRALLNRGPAPTQPDELGYTSWFPEGGLIEVLGYFKDVSLYNLGAYGTFLPDQLFRPAFVGLAILVVLAVAALIGAYRFLSRAPELSLPLLAQLALILVWPFAQDRFVVPLLPFIGLAALGAVLRSQPGAEIRPLGERPSLDRLSPGVRRVGWGLCALVVLLVGSRQVRIRAGTFVPGDQSVLYHPSRFLVENSVALLTAGQWVERNAAPQDVVLAPFAPALYLYTGRKTVNADPAQPDIGASVFDHPGEFLARRAVEDGVTVLILMGADFDVVRDVAEVQQQCPESLQYLDSVERPTPISVYRIHLNECLRSMAVGTASVR